MTDVTATETTAIEGGANCQGFYLHLGDFGVCIGVMTP